MKRYWTSEISIGIRQAVVRRSSAVEQLTVNQLVVGSIPTAGAIFHNINSKMKCVVNVILLYNKSYKEL